MRGLLLLALLQPTSARNDVFGDDHDDEVFRDRHDELAEELAEFAEPLPASSVWDRLAEMGTLCGGSTGDTCLRGYGLMGGDRELFSAIDQVAPASVQ